MRDKRIEHRAYIERYGDDMPESRDWTWTAPGDERPIGGIKVVTEHGWFAVRPSGTEAVYKLYAESFRGGDHLRRIQEQAQAVIRKVLRAGGER
jgi:phosphoglucomutase